MKNITTDNIFEDIGFDKQEAANMKVRAELLLEIREYIRKKGLKKKDAAALLGITQSYFSFRHQSSSINIHHETEMEKLFLKYKI